MDEIERRPIKFRIAISSPHWDEEPGSTKISEPMTLGQIIDHEQIDFTDGGHITWNDIDWGQDTVSYLQYTGLTDGQGTEIYESDVVGDYVGEHKGQPVTASGSWQEVLWEGCGFNLDATESYLVVGNIFQNGDLLNDKASAIAFDGGAGDKCRLVLDLFSEQPAELLKLLKLRGERLIVTFVKEDDIHQGG